MRVSREQASLNKERILDCAARLFRERGFEGVGVDAVMGEAGLTHGGFYGHFANKDDLIAQACQRAISDFLAHWRPKGVEALIESYLSEQHLRNPGRGCLLASLGSDLGRQPERIQASVRPALWEMLEFIGEGDRELGIYRCSTLVGALVLARNLGSEVLGAVRTNLRVR